MLDFSGLDKLPHLFFSYLIGLYDPALAWLLGLLKEGYDAVFRGGVDAADLITNGIGIWLATW